jgi:hypothetical protein
MSGREGLVLFGAAALLALGAGAGAQKLLGPTPQDVAAAYGAESLGRFDRLGFTFNVERDGQRLVSRTWTWSPKTGQVVHKSTDPDGQPVEAAYDRAQLGSAPAEPLAAIEAQFVNDTYWLLFPWHVVNDSEVEVTRDGPRPLPIGEGEAPRLTVAYTGQGGYTPGDVYELYVGPDNRILQWVYRRSGTGEPRAMTWADHVRLGPLWVAREHLSTDSRTRVWISELSATLDGQELTAQSAD